MGGEFDQLLHKIDLAIRFHSAPSQQYLAEFLDHQRQVLTAISHDSEYFVLSFYIPCALMALFQLPALFIERTSGLAVVTRTVTDASLDFSGDFMPKAACSYQKAFHYLLEGSFIPPPAGIIASNYACDDAWMYLKAESRRYSAPFYFLDIDLSLEKAHHQYLSWQMEELYGELKKEYEQKESFEEVASIINQTLMYKKKIDKMREDYPGIFSSAESFKIFTLFNDLGSRNGLSVMKKLYEKVRLDTLHYQEDRSKRILWLGLVPLYQPTFLTAIEKRFQCKVVYEELFHYPDMFIGKDRFFKDLSKFILKTPFISFEERMRKIIEYTQKYHVDGVVHFSQRNCLFLPPMIPHIRAALEKPGIPFVELHGDAVNSRFFDQKRSFDQLETLFE